MEEYHKISKLLHWSTALIVLPMLALSFFLKDLPAIYQASAYTLHKSLGLIVLMLIIVRIFWVLKVSIPKLPSETPKWERIFARSVQHSFYILLILMPLSGWIMATASKRSPVFLGLITVPCPWITPNQSLADFMNATHKVLAWVIIALLILHIAGALKHHFLNKDNVLKKMLF